MNNDITTRLHKMATTYDDVPLWCVDIADEAADEIERLRALVQWQSIETAPNDRPHIRGLWVTDKKTGSIAWEQCFGQVDDETGEFVTLDGDYTGWADGDWTHWLPLPEPPKEEAP